MLLRIFGILLALGSGVGLKLLLNYLDYSVNLSWATVAVGATLVVPIVLLGDSIGINASKASLVRYNESWGGFETRATWDKVHCSRNGPCIREYDCNPHEVVDSYAYTDSDGVFHPEQSHTEWDDCPYTDEEWVFSVETTLGRYVIAPGNLPTNPARHKWHDHDIPNRLPRGVPAFWAAAKARLDRWDPGPVVARRQYDNYILASTNQTLKRYSSDIGQYREAGLLQPPPHSIHHHYHGDKVLFVGTKLPGNWQFAAQQFDAALGSDLQGDLYLVIVNANLVPNPEEYKNALAAFWQSKSLGKNALSKNGIGVIVASRDGQTIDWARAFTGMPVGNGVMLAAIRNQLPGSKLDPTALFGHPKAVFYQKDGKTKVRIVHSQGILEQILWNPGTRFTRVCMRKRKCKNVEGVGFSYLQDQIQPSNGKKWLIGFLVFLFSLLVWAAVYVVAYSFSPYNQNRNYY